MACSPRSIDWRMSSSGRGEGMGRAWGWAFPRAVDLFERRVCAPEDDGRALAVRPLEGDFARVVARDVVLLVGRLMFFVEDDEPEGAGGRKDRRARADHDIDLAVADRPPLPRAVGFGEDAVEDGDAAESRFESRDRLRRERDLRDEDDRLLSLLDRAGERAEVDIAFSAAGHAVKEDDAALFDRGERLLLGGREADLFGLFDDRVRHGVDLRPDERLFKKSGADHRGDGRG